MRSNLDPALTGLTGSATRARTLVPLASAGSPLTAYRIAALAGVPRTKVYRELRRLGESGLVERVGMGRNRSGWTLVDPDLRRFVSRRAQILWSGDIKANSEALRKRTQQIIAESAKLPLEGTLLSGDLRPSTVREIARSPSKDELLASLKLRVSRRVQRRR